MLASVNGFAEICSILLISGADVSIKEKVCAPEFLNMLKPAARKVRRHFAKYTFRPAMFLLATALVTACGADMEADKRRFPALSREYQRTCPSQAPQSFQMLPPIVGET